MDERVEEAATRGRVHCGIIGQHDPHDWDNTNTADSRPVLFWCDGLDPAPAQVDGEAQCTCPPDEFLSPSDCALHGDRAPNQFSNGEELGVPSNLTGRARPRFDVERAATTIDRLTAPAQDGAEVEALARILLDIADVDDLGWNNLRTTATAILAYAEKQVEDATARVREQIAQAIEAKRVHVHKARLSDCDDGCGWRDLAADTARAAGYQRQEGPTL